MLFCKEVSCTRDRIKLKIECVSNLLTNVIIEDEILTLDLAEQNDGVRIRANNTSCGNLSRDLVYKHLVLL